MGNLDSAFGSGGSPSYGHSSGGLHERGYFRTKRETMPGQTWIVAKKPGRQGGMPKTGYYRLILTRSCSWQNRDIHAVACRASSRNRSEALHERKGVREVEVHLSCCRENWEKETMGIAIKVAAWYDDLFTIITATDTA